MSTSKNAPKVKLSKIALLSGALLAPTLTLAQNENGTIIGSINNALNDRNIEGAIVRIEELGRETSSSSDGRYRFNAVKPGSYTLVVDYLGLEADTIQIVVEPGGIVNQLFNLGEDRTEIVIVSGQSERIASARNKQRAADIVKDIVDSVQTGQFADQNIAESLQRLPGINIDRTEGEGRFVTIRGLGPEFNTVSINGISVGTSSSGFELTGSGPSRATRLDVIPSDLLDTIEVSKTRTPDMDGDSIGGSIELKALSAFNTDGFSLGFRAEGSYNEKAGDTSPKISGRWTDYLDKDEKWGLAVAASYFSRKIDGDELRNDTGLREVSSFVDATTLEEITDPDARPTFYRIEEIDQRREMGERDRTGLTVNLDFRPSDDNEFFFRYTTTTLEDEDIRIQQEWEVRDAGGTANENLLIQARSGITTDADIEKQIFFQNSEEQVDTFGIGGKHFVGAWTLDYQLAYSKNEFTNSGIRGRHRERDNALQWDVSDTQDPVVSAFFGDPDEPPLNAASSSDIRGDSRVLENFEFNELLYIEDESNDEVTSIEFNAQYDLSFGDMPGYLKFGLKNRKREKDNDRVDAFSTDPADITGITQANLADWTVFNPDSDLHGPEFGNFPSLSEFRSVLFGNLDEAFTVREQNPTEESNTFRGDYIAEESVLASYAMMGIDVTDEVRLIGGIRVEKTDWDTEAFLSQRVSFDGDFEDIFENTFLGTSKRTSDDSYTDVLPSLHLRYEPTEKIVIRSSFTQAVQRPSFFDTIPRLNSVAEVEGDDLVAYSDAEVFVEVDAGNTNLEAAKATQFDASIAWYPSRASYLSVGIFRKKINDFFVDAVIQGTEAIRGFGIETEDFQVVDTTTGNPVTFDGSPDELEITINGDDATVQGIEVSYSQLFSSGLFIDSNFALLDSEANLGEPRPDEEIALPNQADGTANVSFGWENELFSSRVSYNWRDDILSDVNSDPTEDLIREAYGSWDLSLKYNITDNFQLYFDAINITEEEDVRLFRGNADTGRLFSRIEDYGRTIQFGVAGNF